MKHIKRFLQIALLVTCLIPVAMPTHAKANTNSTSYQTTSGVNFRTGPSTKYKVIRYLKRGTSVNHLGRSGKWSKIKVGNNTGYVSSSYLKTNGVTNTSTPTGTTYKTRANVNFRTGPSTKYGKIAYLYKGTTVKYLGKSGAWSKVQVNGKTGYVSTSYLSMPASTTTTNEKGTPHAIKSRVNFRRGPSTKYGTIRKLYKGNKVELLSRHNKTWSKIKVNGTVGYVSHKYLTTTSTPSTSTPTPPSKAPANSLGFKGGTKRKVLDMKKYEGSRALVDPKYKHFVHADVNTMQGLIDKGHIARWGAPIDNYDGKTTWIMSHAGGGFKYMRSTIKVGSLVEVTDRNGRTRTYKITDNKRNASNSWDLKFSNGDVLWDIYMDGGSKEGILLQMCQVRNGVSANHFYLGKPIN